jgi:hypothetical protein
MIDLRNTADDPACNDHIIEAIARESEAPVEHVRKLFEAEHQRLISVARIKTFVSVLATRLVKKTLNAERARQ